MEKDLLQVVIKAESEIQQAVESERKRAAEWLEAIRISLSKELETKKQELAEEFKQSLARTCKECKFHAKEEIGGSLQMIENIQNLPDRIIQETVKDFLLEILPEK